MFIILRKWETKRNSFEMLMVNLLLILYLKANFVLLSVVEINLKFMKPQYLVFTTSLLLDIDGSEDY
jgi:hypothetical protein